MMGFVRNGLLEFSVSLCSFPIVTLLFSNVAISRDFHDFMKPFSVDSVNRKGVTHKAVKHLHRCIKV